MRINVQLIDARSDQHRWAETYDREPEGRVRACRAKWRRPSPRSLSAKLSQGELAALKQKPTDIPAAYEAYLKARALEAKVVVQTMQQAEPILDAYREAVRLDPRFALAWADLATRLFRVSWIGLDPSGALNVEGAKAMARARELAPGLPQAELARGVHMYYVERDFPGALAVMNSLPRSCRTIPICSCSSAT